MEAKSSERGANVRFAPPFVFLISLLLGVVLRYAVAPIPLAGHGSLVRWAGVAIVLGGLTIGVPARTLFARTGQNPKPWTPSPELLLSGPYRFTRNPMYVGVTLVQVGLGLAFKNLWISVLAPFSLLVVHFTAVLPEERYLTERFGESYRAYQEKVGRYL
ncbi:MAG: isoprenylcysteine carboxylmethyltransferase family protein [Acidobacteriia bacterium]|nr:isoprenylcysteine carboxylmethyltransferase family protein [Terriglobia bacterium]